MTVQTHQHQKLHTGEKPYRSRVRRTSFVKRCESHVLGEPLVFCEVRKDSLPSSGLLQQEATHTGEKTNSETKQRPPFQRKKLTRAPENAQKPSAPNSCSAPEVCPLEKDVMCAMNVGNPTYSKRNSFNNHQRVHPGERPYDWVEGGQSFSQRTTSFSISRDTQEKGPCKCAECGKSFRYKSHHFEHQRVHTGERPYNCGVCGKLFYKKSHLLVHQSVHTGERPLKCNECGKAFTHSSALRVCQRVHTTQKPCECNEGRKSFAENSTLIKHKRVHTGERPYECSECGKPFAETSSFINQDFPWLPKKDFKLCDFYL
ncbi:PREDICTED: zinc finger protein 776-like [Propithecus coquereli]|uniref:zinc finger protein 776-like n=1 Tax=Propithecus coquereli TaxID=379532 RepID=UPI00063F36E1|nr:PREDICTED: zinc finger protein 776-like [Propithecus coquereli]